MGGTEVGRQARRSELGWWVKDERVETSFY